MLNWFRWLMPRQEMFFPLFEQHAKALLAGAQALREMLNGGEQLGHRCKEVVAQEQKADDITRDVMVGIRTSFITPFDRADIQEPNNGNGRCNRSDAANGKGHCIVRDGQASRRRCGPWPMPLSNAPNSCGERFHLLSDLGANATSLNDICVQIARIEGHADEIHDRGLKSLYTKAKAGDPMEFVRGNEIYNHLEESVDRFDDVANEIQGNSYRTRLRKRCFYSMISASLALVIGSCRSCFDFRLSQRSSRRRELDRDRGFNAGALTARRRRLGGMFQFHRLPVLRPACRPDDGDGPHLRECRGLARGVRRPHGRHQRGIS